MEDHEGKQKEVRTYMIGQNKIKLSAKMVEKFMEWNTSRNMLDGIESEESTQEAMEYDERMTIALLLRCVTPGNIARNAVAPEVKNFIKGNF